MPKQTFLEEVLFRFGPDGLVGAHAVYMDRYTDDETGEVIAERLRQAQPVTPASDAAELVGEAVAGFAGQVTALLAENARLSAENARLSTLISKQASTEIET